MNVRHTQGVLHSFYIKNILYDKIDLRLFYYDVAISQMASTSSITLRCHLNEIQTVMIIASSNSKNERTGLHQNDEKQNYTHLNRLANER